LALSLSVIKLVVVFVVVVVEVTQAEEEKKLEFKLKIFLLIFIWWFYVSKTLSRHLSPIGGFQSFGGVRQFSFVGDWFGALCGWL
jgi:hypothetical protein